MRTLTLLIAAFAFIILTYEPAPQAATCVGATPCRACHTCGYCKLCAHNGGTCGVCRR